MIKNEERKKIVVVFDTNINEIDEPKYFPKLKKYHDEEKIILIPAEMVQNELENYLGKRAEAIKEAMKNFESTGNFSIFPLRFSFTFISEEDGKNFNEIKSIMFGNQLEYIEESETRKKLINDLRNAFSSYLIGADYFLTMDKKHILKPKIKKNMLKEFGLKLVSPEECLNEVEERIGEKQ